ncbi:MAG: SWIM zinc finger family protein [Betaproteobacteria bacterium]|nr:SWIM zinc finger family protein [Betaproteobacteria bacterium]
MGWYGYGDYVSVAEKKEKAKKQLEKLRKKDQELSPIIIEGKKIAKTWWGMAWCKNLESYADYSNRIGRGSAYVKNGFVLDLKIEQGVIRGKVYGSQLYNITIQIDKLDNASKELVTGAIGHKIDSVEDLLSGDFPKEFGEIFLTQRKGLFPSPREIRLKCSCPDWADMCKHVAAVLYGVGARLDSDPLLFFKLRGIDVGEFIKKSIDEKVRNMMKNAGSVTARVLKDADIANIFGI